MFLRVIYPVLSASRTRGAKRAAWHCGCSRALAAEQPWLGHFHPFSPSNSILYKASFIYCTEERGKAWKRLAHSGFVTKGSSGDSDDEVAAERSGPTYTENQGI